MNMLVDKQKWWRMYVRDGALTATHSGDAWDTANLLPRWGELSDFLRRVSVHVTALQLGRQQMYYLLETKRDTESRQFRISVVDQPPEKEQGWEAIGLYATQEQLMPVLESYLQLEDGA